jgi:ribosomal-protein-alanine N-acetyltransferase
MVLDEAHLLNLSVVRTWQNKGCGAALLRRLCDMAREHGAIRMYLEVRPSNRAALALYRRSGFTDVGVRRGYYPALFGREDAIVMSVDF